MLRQTSFRAAVCALCLVTWGSAYAQDSSANSRTEPCTLPSASQADNTPDVAVSLAEITFWGLGIQMPTSEQREIATTVKNVTHGSSVSDVVDEALALVREEWQNRGYFHAQVTGEATTISSNAVSERISISVHVEEGFQYRLREITFKNNKVFTNLVALRSLFPIKDGDLWNREQFAKGLESLKRAYASRGFIKFISIPEPNYDDSARLVSFAIDVDEGEQFHLGDIRLQGIDDLQREKVLDSFLLKPGDVFNEDLLQKSLDLQGLPDCSCDGIQRHIDVKRRTIDIVLDFRPCT